MSRSKLPGRLGRRESFCQKAFDTTVSGVHPRPKETWMTLEVEAQKRVHLHAYPDRTIGWEGETAAKVIFSGDGGRR